MSVVGNCGVQSSCSKSFLCIWLSEILGPRSSDDFSPTDTTSPLWNLLLGIREILPLGKAAFYGTGAGEPLDVVRDGTRSQCHDGVWSLPVPSLSWQIYSLLHLGDAANKFLLASCNTGHAPDKHIWLKPQVSTWEKNRFKKARWPICWETLQTGGGISLGNCHSPVLAE